MTETKRRHWYGLIVSTAKLTVLLLFSFGCSRDYDPEEIVLDSQWACGPQNYECQREQSEISELWGECMNEKIDQAANAEEGDKAFLECQYKYNVAMLELEERYPKDEGNRSAPTPTTMRIVDSRSEAEKACSYNLVNLRDEEKMAECIREMEASYAEREAKDDADSN